MSPTTDYMKHALALARQAVGTTSPNPAVGAVVVKDGTVLGDGFTLPPGQGHAEIVALERAGEDARAASLYVTLEPCCTYGRTPPCTQAIIAAGVAEVHVATVDPNPKVNGKGLADLKVAGIKVHLGALEHETTELYEAFAKHINTGTPFVTAKFAMSLDGKIATHTGDSMWITGAAARAHVHTMRRACDAIMVGVNTVLRDDPQLTARDAEGRPLPRQPLRVVLDGSARTPTDARLLKEPGCTLIVVTEADENRIASLRAAGAEVVKMPAAVDGTVDLHALLKALGARGVVSLMVEGGGTLLGSFFDRGLVDKVVAFIAPTIIGGGSAPSPVGGAGIASVSLATRLTLAEVERVGDDLLLVGYPAARSVSAANSTRATEG